MKTFKQQKQLMTHGGWFTQFSKAVAWATGQPGTFGLAAASILVWILSGPIFGFSDTWQLIINTGTTIITFLMVFLIQNTQNRDSQAVHLKLDELIRATKGAHLAIIDLEELTDRELHAIKEDYLELAEEGRRAIRRGGQDTDTPDVKHDLPRTSR